MIQDDACRSQFMLCMFCIVENYFDFQEIFVCRGERVFLSLQETVILLCTSMILVVLYEKFHK
jgi:hypothetical protein